MNSKAIDGNRIRDEILLESKARVERVAARGRPPGLAVILVGEDPASQIYVRNKIKTCEGLGIHSEKLTPPPSIATGDLIEMVRELNRRDEIDGVLVQMPLPKHIDSKSVLMAISPDKDVDGLHPVSVGNLVTNRLGLRPCTPLGVIEILKRNQVPIAGARAVVVGRSDLVGKPVAFLLLHEHATVTLCHSRTVDLPGVCRQADILVAAMGRAAMITAEYIKPGATVIDVGINRISDRAQAAAIFAQRPDKLAQFEQKGSILVGDVHPVEVAACAGLYTPVPGGVGPLTIAMLMSNTIDAAERRLGGC
ncbi:MAG: bifunctional 5,10-methylenetetrahydrofolate dehydrogenase/5,10-methenyltetrahydrofolate cyclohydrolase [Bryobacterales bacterium]|nr:bifunctional 5,10-methylenetetrahydrofolate dehydrogenase/5,10-methenyltetrahydrofolate cyclohydrolase [Bryobacterales bacterium]